MQIKKILSAKRNWCAFSNPFLQNYFLKFFRPGDMILMDGGCEFNGYASDITRTWPVDGKFTKEQGTIYSIVLEVQKMCLKV